MRLKKLFKNTKGATAIEYGMLAALIGIGIMASLKFFGSSLTQPINAAGTAISTGIAN
jgi:pilus assembly protein Flp/PilA